ncbi:hypothetical protein [Kocuria turfanensis]|uniref:Uncharacterized protein n=1 Tax=Kocuria turfanensis TaxID=388357 RepID=A0A512IGI0_9MICC|nr:hypothetical protein [Kocuria turfanensis]GEO96819.1 hypothetical protein KTU01_29420 [Kocuria turfanensis]
MDQSAPRTDEVPVPRAGQVLVRTLPAALMLAIGLPGLALWGLDENGNAGSGWFLFLPGLLVPAALLLHRLTRAPRPDLPPATERAPLTWDLAIAAETGRLPPRSSAQAATALACRQVEMTVLVGAAALGATITWAARAVWLWLVLATLCAATTLVAGRRARHGWAYLQAANSTGRPTPSGGISVMLRAARQTTEVPVPTAGQVLVRALPEAAVMIVGLPLVVRFVLDENGDTSTPWWPVPLLALVGLVMLVDRCAQAPRPRFDQRVGEAQWKPAFAAAVKTGTLPEHPEVRTAVGVVACRTIEGVVVGIAMVVSVALSALAAPGFPWLGALGVLSILTGINAFRVRRSWAYLRALHTAERTGRRFEA